MTSYFYLQADKDSENVNFVSRLENYASEQKMLIYILNRPLMEQRYVYDYKKALIVMSPKHKIAIVNYEETSSGFTDYIEDILEDIGYIADKYRYKEVLGRPRVWRDSLLNTDLTLTGINDVKSFFDSLKLTDSKDIRKIDLLISLFIGSINDIDRVKADIPQNILDKVKQKIQLFDGDQTRFVYERLEGKKIITIQGLSGTGKTELLLNKLKDLYISDPKALIYFTCHNKILSDELRRRIPAFFNFMKVEQQIEWEKRLWCTSAWGSAKKPNSGVYSYICDFYDIPFLRYSPKTFSEVCKIALDELKNKKIDHAFTYMLIDESQDFDENFFMLCELVTEKNVYIAGDVFQSIFDEKISSSIRPDYLLGKCYRTDPKTLMFAHGLGMGLFEETKLRWLEKKDWEDCGYNVNIENSMYYLTRESPRRFEDLEDDFESIVVKTLDSSTLLDSIVKIIQEIRYEYKTVLPDDIGIIFLDSNNGIYELANRLEVKINRELEWEVNKAYETKEKKENTILISNRNNVKGLEFPFVICISVSIESNLAYRNSLYTMLTRSFIRSFFVIYGEKSGFTPGMEKALEQIITKNVMVISEPSSEEKNKIQTRFETERKKKSSFYDIIMKLLNELKIDKVDDYYDKIAEVAKKLNWMYASEDKIIDNARKIIKMISENEND